MYFNVYLLLKHKLKQWGIFLGLVNESATFTCKVMGITFLIYEFLPCNNFHVIEGYLCNVLGCSIIHMLKQRFFNPVCVI
jgi:hypothetical protein